MIKTDVVIIGAGPVGLFAIHQLGIKGLKAEVIDNLDKAGGQCIELYPDKPIYDIPAVSECNGKSLTDDLLKQVKPFKTNFHFNERVQEIKEENGKWKVRTNKDKEFLTPNIIIAGGVGSFEPRKLPLKELERFEDIFKKAKQKKIPVRGYVSCIVECPYEGKVKPEKVLEVTTRLLDMGCYEVSLGDTIGKGTPKTVDALLKVICENLHAQQLAGHFHDTSDTAIKNVEIALKYGITTFDTAIGGLGGCPYAPGAKGNLSTVQLINAIGIENFLGIPDLEMLLCAEKYLFNFNIWNCVCLYCLL